MQRMMSEIVLGVRDILFRMLTDRASRSFGVVALTACVLFVVAYRVVETQAPGSALANALAISRDGSLTEIYGYALALFGAGCLLVAWWRTGVLTYAGGALTLLFVFADDAFRYHERVAYWLIARFELPVLPGTRPQDTGEIIAWAAAGVVLGAVMLWSALQRTGVTLRIWTLIGGMIAGLLVFGVLLDLVHSTVKTGFVAYLEDGGELAMLALSAWAALAIARRPWTGRLGDDAASRLWRSLRRRMGAPSHDPLREPSGRAGLHAQPER